MQAGVAAVIAAVVCDMGEGVIRTHSLLDELIMVAAFVLNYFLGVNVVLIIFACILIGLARSFLKEKKVSV